MNVSFLSGLITFVTGIIYLVMTLFLEDAALGNPAEPKYFPLMIALMVTVLSIVLMIKGFKAKPENKDNKGESYFKQIGLTCIFSAAYALLFDKAGYVIATILFLEGMLWLFNGPKWKQNTIVAFSFSLFIYIVFAKLLSVYLPALPFLYI